MKGRESGMPEEGLWATLFDVPLILSRLGVGSEIADAVEFGCGYGTFTIPVAQRIRGLVHAMDIEPEMIAATETKAKAANLVNVQTRLCDFIAEGCGLPDASMDFAMLFNILHVEDPVGLVQEARRVLVPGGRLGVIHWNYDASTPRGPSMDIRPKPEQCVAWMKAGGLDVVTKEPVALPPYHYGLIGKKRTM